MPVGPVYEGGFGESLHFLLETVGEDVIRASPRLFYNYRAVEKIAEGKSISDVLLLAERFAATSAFAHSLAFCQAVEKIYSVEVPTRAAQPPRPDLRTGKIKASRGCNCRHLRVHCAGSLQRHKPPSSKRSCCEPPASSPDIAISSG